jgi:hypothetical protein
MTLDSEKLALNDKAPDEEEDNETPSEYEDSEANKLPGQSVDVAPSATFEFVNIVAESLGRQCFRGKCEHRLIAISTFN